MHPDDERLAQLLPLLRKRMGLTQAQLAVAAGIPRDDIWHMEAGRAAEVRLSRIRRVMEAVDGRARLSLWWHGAAADRLLDERHAALGLIVTTRSQALGWMVLPEVTFQRFGERGQRIVIDGLEVGDRHPETSRERREDIVVGRQALGNGGFP